MNVNHFGHRLRGRTVFMSASVPSPLRGYTKIANAGFEIDQAVISLTRAVLSESGSLVFGGHPSISPLVATVAAEYHEPVLAEDTRERPSLPIRIYQSEAFRGFEPAVTPMMYRLGYAHLDWVESFEGERFDPKKTGAPQCEESLRRMRREMMLRTEPDAMVCIGGMEGVEREAEMFAELRPGRPIFTLAMSGGAAARLPNLRRDVTVMDVPVVQHMQERRRQREVQQSPSLDHESDALIVPYPLVMQMIVDRIA